MQLILREEIYWAWTVLHLGIASILLPIFSWGMCGGFFYVYRLFGIDISHRNHYSINEKFNPITRYPLEPLKVILTTEHGWSRSAFPQGGGARAINETIVVDNHVPRAAGFYKADVKKLFYDGRVFSIDFKKLNDFQKTLPEDDFWGCHEVPSEFWYDLFVITQNTVNQLVFVHLQKRFMKGGFWSDQEKSSEDLFEFHLPVEHLVSSGALYLLPEAESQKWFFGFIRRDKSSYLTAF